MHVATTGTTGPERNTIQITSPRRYYYCRGVKTRVAKPGTHACVRWRDACCAIFNVSYDQLDNDDKSNIYVAPRHWCWYMMASVSMLNIDSIVKLLNNQKNRTSVLHAIRKIHFYIHRKNPDRKSMETFNRLLNFYQNQ
jgi:hypothetical protein